MNSFLYIITALVILLDLYYLYRRVRKYRILEKGDIVGLRSQGNNGDIFFVEDKCESAGHKYIVVSDGSGYLWNFTKDQLFIRIKHYHKDKNVKPYNKEPTQRDF